MKLDSITRLEFNERATQFIKNKYGTNKECARALGLADASIISRTLSCTRPPPDALLKAMGMRQINVTFFIEEQPNG